MIPSYLIDPKSLSVDEWLSYVLSDEKYEQLFYCRCFPSPQFTEQFIDRAQTLKDKQIKIIL
ncbi:hypothetical protein BSK66_12565 [Paenibacillus odorifer]|nr:hypothetical protein BSK66_12565 [Paenibacillus odorifer]